jgi:hypothetical protein
MATTKTKTAPKKAANRKATPRSVKSKGLAIAYNATKYFEGTQYTGMKVCRSQKWYYDKGEWKEKNARPTNGNFPTR